MKIGKSLILTQANQNMTMGYKHDNKLISKFNSIGSKSSCISVVVKKDLSNKKVPLQQNGKIRQKNKNLQNNFMKKCGGIKNKISLYSYTKKQQKLLTNHKENCNTQRKSQVLIQQNCQKRDNLHIILNRNFQEDKNSLNKRNNSNKSRKKIFDFYSARQSQQKLKIHHSSNDLLEKIKSVTIDLKEITQSLQLIEAVTKISQNKEIEQLEKRRKERCLRIASENHALKNKIENKNKSKQKLIISFCKDKQVHSPFQLNSQH